MISSPDSTRSRNLRSAKSLHLCSSQVSFRIMTSRGGTVMSSLDEMSQRIAAYRDGRISLSDFENWFEDNSSAAYAVPELKSVWAAVDAAFSQYPYDHIGEEAMKVELANAILPFVSIPENR